MHLDLGLVADGAHVDGHGKLYILGEFRYLYAQQFPAMHPRLALVCRLTAPIVEVRDLKAKLRLEVVDEDGSPLLPKTPEMPVVFAPVGPAERGSASAVVVLEFQGLPIRKPGPFTFHVWVDGNRIGDFGFHALQVQAPATPGGTP